MRRINKIVVGGTPGIRQEPYGDTAATEDVIQKYSALINVSDSCGINFHLAARGFPAFWFPIHETHHWTHAPFYGAAKVLDWHRATKQKKPVFLHCHGGTNRGACVAAAILLAEGFNRRSRARIIGRDPTVDWNSNLLRGNIPSDVVEFLKARYDCPSTYSIMGLLQHIKSPYYSLPKLKGVTFSELDA